MAKIEKASEELVELFDKIKENNTSIPHWLQFEVLCNNKQKELYKIVKMNDIVEIITEGVNFAVVFNETIFDQLLDNHKEMAIIECLAGVSVSDTDKVTLEKPNFSTYRGVLEKFGHDIVILHESIKSLFDSQKQKEDEVKAQVKEKKSKRRKF